MWLTFDTIVKPLFLSYRSADPESLPDLVFSGKFMLIGFILFCDLQSTFALYCGSKWKLVYQYVSGLLYLYWMQKNCSKGFKP
jgi:hypothetical protein